jgi:tetratricopeptide (TPR) repeat protein
MRALHAGRFEEAERLVGEELDLGPGLTEDTTYIAQYVAQLHRWALGRERGVLAEVREELERFVAEYPLFMSRCLLVSLYSEVDEEATAVAELERLAAEGFQDLELRCEWFFGASLLAEACERLGEATHAPRLYEVLLPYRDNVVITHPELDLGSAARYLGLLASVMGRTDDALSHYEAALRTNERLGASPWLARTQADLSRALLARGAAGDAERAHALAGTALATFGALGMVEPAERLRRGMATARAGGPSP